MYPQGVCSVRNAHSFIPFLFSLSPGGAHKKPNLAEQTHFSQPLAFSLLHINMHCSKNHKKCIDVVALSILQILIDNQVGLLELREVTNFQT